MPGGSCPICWMRGKQTFWTALVNSRMSRHFAHPRQLLHFGIVGADGGKRDMGVLPNPRSGPLYTVDVFCLCAYAIDDRQPVVESIRRYIPQKHVMSLAAKPKLFGRMGG